MDVVKSEWVLEVTFVDFQSLIQLYVLKFSKPVTLRTALLSWFARRYYEDSSEDLQYLTDTYGHFNTLEDLFDFQYLTGQVDQERLFAVMENISGSEFMVPIELR